MGYHSKKNKQGGGGEAGGGDGISRGIEKIESGNSRSQ